MPEAFSRWETRKIAFRLVHARYDRETEKAYVELRDLDDDGGEMLATAIFSYRTTARLSKREIEEDVVRKARHIFRRASHTLNGG